MGVWRNWRTAVKLDNTMGHLPTKGQSEVFAGSSPVAPTPIFLLSY